jgi:3-oxoacyl-[acyl-carrier-protein] synthase II
VQSKAVVATGMGTVTSAGLGESALRTALAEGRSLSAGKLWEYQELGDRVGFAAVPAYDRRAQLPDLRPPYPSRYCQFALISASEALESADLIDTPSEMGTIVATDLGPNATVEKIVDTLSRKGPKAVSPLTFAASTSNVALGQIALAWKLQGPSSLILGENPVVYALDLLKDGRAAILLCGGLDETRDVHVWAQLQDRLGQESTEQSPTVGASMLPLLGEGSAFLVLESADHARGRGADIRGEILGACTLRDPTIGYRISDVSPRVLRSSMQGALEEAHIRAESVSSLVMASNPEYRRHHDEVTVAEDLAGHRLVAVAPKATVGETFGASGPLAVIAALDPSLPPKSVCLVNSVHIGGTVCSVVVRT